MKLLTVLLCEDTCARCSPFQKAGGQCPVIHPVPASLIGSSSGLIITAHKPVSLVPPVIVHITPTC